MKTSSLSLVFFSCWTSALTFQGGSKVLIQYFTCIISECQSKQILSHKINVCVDHSTPDQGCLDDSDCVPLGHKFACFFYKCLNWVDKYIVSYSSLTFGHNKPSTDGGSTRGVAWSSRFAIMKNKHGQTPYNNCSQACFLLIFLVFVSYLFSFLASGRQEGVVHCARDKECGEGGRCYKSVTHSCHPT